MLDIELYGILSMASEHCGVIVLTYTLGIGPIIEMARLFAQGTHTPGSYPTALALPRQQKNLLSQTPHQTRV